MEDSAKPNIMWADNEELAIGFDHRPNTNMVEVDLFKFPEKYPFINCTRLRVWLFDKVKSKAYHFDIPKSFRWDGATIPSLVWFIFGCKTDNRYRNPSMLHDYMCNNKYVVCFDREFSTKIFKAMLLKNKVNKTKANIMCFFVDLWQRFQTGWEDV